MRNQRAVNMVEIKNYMLKKILNIFVSKHKIRKYAYAEPVLSGKR